MSMVGEAVDADMKEIAKNSPRDIIIYDIESTGIDVNFDQIIQFHATRIQKKTGKSKELTFVCQPTVPINPKASEVNGYTIDKLKDKPKFSHFTKQIFEFFKDADIGGYNNSKFDDLILSRQMKENGVEDFLKDRLSFDAYVVYLGHLNKKLAGAIEFYINQKPEDLHDAKNDVEYTVKVIAAQIAKEQLTIPEIINKMLEKQKERQASDLERYLVKNEQGDWVLNFSKHKGIKLKEADPSFLQWIMGKEFPQSFKDILKDYVK